MTHTARTHRAGSPRSWWCRRRGTLAVAAALLLLWAWTVLHTQLAVLAVVLAVTAAAVCVFRFCPAAAAGVGVASAASAAPLVGSLLVVAQQRPGGASIVAALTGWILTGPIPAMVAWAGRPALTRRVVDAALGSLVLLAGAVPVTLGAYSFAALLLLGSLTAATAVILGRRRSALRRRLDELPTANGWTELARRRLPGGAAVDHLLVGNGHAVAAWTAEQVTAAALTAAAVRAAQVADVLHLPPSRVQPALIVDRAPPDAPFRQVATPTVSADVAVLGSVQDLDALARAAPRRRRGQRRALLAAAALPTAPLNRAGSRVAG